MSHTILIADDEKEIAEILRLYFEKEGYQVIEAGNGREALQLLQEQVVDLVVMDIMMPDMDGLQAIRQIRRTRQLPVILLSAKGQDHDKILGLGMGADDYMTKPFNPLEVVARVQAQLRRTYNWNAAPTAVTVSSPITIGSLTLDAESCSVSRNGAEVTLTSTEFRMLKHFMEHSGRVFTKRQLYEAVWGDIYGGDDNTIMVCISKLRDKIEDDPAHPYLVTIRGLGYKFVKRMGPV
ncbi:response regulator transcription factor [Paenibacillus alginolyticus]|uniref:Response regulator transcription factor n=1 Tax=Paenibacillus alginolyticus TaxID=59839 RepID=A0ABT4G597_9BACL|nr:response regulator transcription factor [Paenibacillus alginolyticus]MCY9667151.1 response regulator transcription factor [Paenibacillus alginolyticus]MCY9691345.1 response regulator transcription factor [Paenibacillus alginolyticus]MEC0146455.1 response regulator transcription factor [Paenibacillus alginolyticus]